MWSTVGFVVLCGLACVLAAPTVHLVKLEEADEIPDYQQLLPTDLPPIVDPVWMTVTARPITETTVVEPLNPQYQPSVRPVQPAVTSYQQPGTRAWQPPQQNPSPSYHPYYYVAPTERPATLPGFSQGSQYPQFPLNEPQYQYHFQSYPQLAWKPAVQHQQYHVRPCLNGLPTAGVQQAYQPHLQRGY